MEDINIAQLKEKIAQGEDFIFIDVREVYEYEEDNLKAQNIPLGELSKHVDELIKQHGLDKNIVVHCRSGARSANAKGMLETAGFTKVQNLLGGILAYRKEG